MRGPVTYAIRCIAFGVIYLAVGLVSAGRWTWLGAYLFAAALAGGMAAQFLLLAMRNPELLRERTTRAGNTKPWDRWLLPLTVVVLPVAALVVAGLDTRFSWTVSLSSGVQWAGLALALGAYALTLVSMASNRFFSSVVRIQVERGHQVHSAGPYRFVRHPGYLGMIGFFLAAPIFLGSVWSFVPALLGVALHVLRTALEDRTLREELPGYEDYARRVRFRLVPGLW